jgi:hypothetical protein
MQPFDLSKLAPKAQNKAIEPEQRLRDLEKKMAALQKEIAALRKELHPQKPADPEAPKP